MKDEKIGRGIQWWWWWWWYNKWNWLWE